MEEIDSIKTISPLARYYSFRTSAEPELCKLIGAARKIRLSTGLTTE